MSPQVSPATVPDAPAEAAEVAALLARLLPIWCAASADMHGEDCSRLVAWLGMAPGGLLDGILEGFEYYRRDQWLQYATDPATVWGRWTGGELERPVYEIMPPTTAAGSRLRLRREAPFGAAEVVDFLGALAAAEEAGKLQDRKAWLLRGVMVDILHEAARRAHQAEDADDLLGPLHRLHQRRRGETIRHAASTRRTLLDQPPPAGLRECLRQLLLPVGEVEGCLAAAHRVRLFHLLPEVAEPLVPREAFTAALGAVDALGAQLESAAEPSATLRETCALLAELGRFAETAGPVLAGPAAGPHRDWLRRLLENFTRLGRLACCLETEQSPRAATPEAEPATAPPDVPPPAPEPSPEDAALAALAPTNPAAEQFLTIVALTDELLRAVRGSWPEAKEALTGLHYPASRFRQKLLRAAAAPAEEQGRQIHEAARQLADELVNKIRRLDALLPGAGACPPPLKGPSSLPPPARERLKALRDHVFEVMRAYGGYDEYPVAVGDSVRKHGPVLDDVAYVSGPRFRPDEVVQILEPGYVRRREDGRQEVIRSPRVLVAR